MTALHSYAGGSSVTITSRKQTAAQRKAASRLAAEQNTGTAIADKYFSGLVTTLASIKSAQDTAVKDIQKYYSAPTPSGVSR